MPVLVQAAEGQRVDQAARVDVLGPVDRPLVQDLQVGRPGVRLEDVRLDAGQVDQVGVALRLAAVDHEVLAVAVAGVELVDADGVQQRRQPLRRRRPARHGQPTGSAVVVTSESPLGSAVVEMSVSAAGSP